MNRRMIFVHCIANSINAGCYVRRFVETPAGDRKQRTNASSTKPK